QVGASRGPRQSSYLQAGLERGRDVPSAVLCRRQPKENLTLGHRICIRRRGDRLKAELIEAGGSGIGSAQVRNRIGRHRERYSRQHLRTVRNQRRTSVVLFTIEHLYGREERIDAT